MLLAHWHRIDDAEPPAFHCHLHGRDLDVCKDAAHGEWHWTVTSPHGWLFAEGSAPSRDAAEQAAEDEATAVHPPTSDLLEHLLR